MICLELPIPPLPQLITVGDSRWEPGMKHFKRQFDVYDLLFVTSGVFHMAEDDNSYSVCAGEMLVLEPGRMHAGYRECEEETIVYFLHFAHPTPLRSLPAEQIAWSTVLRQGSTTDSTPTEQVMYLPKYGRIQMEPAVATLREMIELHDSFTLHNSLRLHSLLGQLLWQLQANARSRQLSPSMSLSEEVIAYLQQRLLYPFDSKELEAHFHFHFDYITRCLKKHTGMTPLRYLHHIRMERAKSLLENTDTSIQDIAEQVGIANYNYFIRLFRQKTGMSPSKYRSSRAGGADL
ncbi:AraC family transcriptional regulator [Paenibacillus sp. J2TS4]|uniref:helix-turn-helix transcriptional regulator n=1 Tax=Paenibacillus sp. J2TS4 TaxID=2807194 RepID=UPI001B18586A|nr:AraC family transcriptional regulator [Paenibacillus sp. J2TS4]GIP33880.1 hypothetical protein J2TS4_30900 [Paenibacillus sp. J2TS4]